jgi:enoyl-CoA hydratase
VTVELTRADAVATVAIARPDKLNALDRETGVLLLDALAACESARAVVLAGTSSVFSAGADMDEPVDDEDNLRLWGAINRRLMELTAVTLAAVEGYCLGGGLVLAAACDLRVAGQGASFGTPEVRHGLVAGTGGTQLLPRLIGSARAKQLLLLGDPIDARTAQTWGLVNWVVPDGTARDSAAELAATIARHSPLAVRESKRLVDEGRELDLQAALELEHQRVRLVAASDEAQRGARAFRKRRPPSSRDDG